MFGLQARAPSAYCDGPAYAYRYFLHAPFESPDFSSKGHLILAHLSTRTILQVTPKVINADESLRDLTPDR